MLDALSMFWQDNPDLYRRKIKTPITYTISYAPLAASPAGQQVQASAQTAKDFVCTRIVGTQTTAGTNAAYILTPLILQIVITATNYNFNNIKTEWGTSGIQINQSAATFSNDLPYPLFIPGASTITTILDNPIATAANVWISFIGIQL